MIYTYPLLEKVFGNFKDHNSDVGDIYLTCCQHILEPQLKMFELLIGFGFDPHKIILLGKAYSTNKEVLGEIEQLGIKVSQPEFSGINFDDEHKNNCKNVLKLIPKDAQIILLDDGAELIKTFADAGRNILFAVEQTSSGFRKIENDKLSFPVVNVARSATKLAQESPLVARHCFERISGYLKDNKINNPSVLVVGLGPIGKSILEVFKENNFSVQGFDAKHGHTELSSFISNMKPDIIIGATGVNILSKDEIEKIALDKPLHLISISSSDREFSVAPFRNNAEIHEDVVYKNITFVNNGFPLTFKGNRYELTPIEIEKTICLLGGSILDGVVNGIKSMGLVDVHQSLEALVNQ